MDQNLKVLSMTACGNRPYLSEVLAHLSRCDGISDYQLLVRAEPGTELGLFRKIDFCGVRIAENFTQMGCNENTFQAVDRAFNAGADRVIHLEDDVLPGRDTLKLMEWGFENYASDPSVFNLSAFSRDGGAEYTVRRNPFFDSWIWGTWADRWAEIARTWDHDTGVSWDVVMAYGLRGDRCEIIPSLSRSQNIGRDGGANMGPEFYDARVRLDHWAPNLAPANYREG